MVLTFTRLSGNATKTAKYAKESGRCVWGELHWEVFTVADTPGPVVGRPGVPAARGAHGAAGQCAQERPPALSWGLPLRHRALRCQLALLLRPSIGQRGHHVDFKGYVSLLGYVPHEFHEDNGCDATRYLF